MADFTIPLKEVVETIFNTGDPLDWEQPYDEVEFNGVKYGKLPTVPDWSQIGLGTYPIFNEDYRPILNGKILDEYFVREIGVETIDMFIFSMRKKMDQIMPYWNKIYETESIQYDPLMTMDIHSVSTNIQEGQEQVEATNTATSNTDSKARAVTSSTPQTMLAGNADYATGATDTNSDSDVLSESNQDSTSSNSTESSGDNRVTGFQGVSSDLVMRYRASLLNIDTLILQDLSELFMQILTSGDSYTRQDWMYL